MDLDMNLLNRSLGLSFGIAALSGALVVSGCDMLGGGDDDAQSGGSPAIEDNTPVLATVNGVNITQKDLDSAISQLPPNVQALPPDQLMTPLMNTLIETELLASEGRNAGLDATQDFLHQIDRFRVFSLREEYVASVQDTAVTEEALQAAYDAEVAAQELTKEVDASHILVDTEEEAIEIIGQLDDGADFAELAQEKSIGPSSENGGNLGFFKKNAMVEAFADSAFTLGAGDVSAEPVQTQFGWHVIKVNEIREVDAPPFQSMRGPLEQRLRQEAMDNKIEELKAAATIERHFDTDEGGDEGGDEGSDEGGDEDGEEDPSEGGDAEE